MKNQNLFNVIHDMCGFAILQDDIDNIKMAIFKDFIIENVDNEIAPAIKEIYTCGCERPTTLYEGKNLCDQCIEDYNLPF